MSDSDDCSTKLVSKLFLEDVPDREDQVIWAGSVGSCHPVHNDGDGKDDDVDGEGEDGDDHLGVR